MRELGIWEEENGERKGGRNGEESEERRREIKGRKGWKENNLKKWGRAAAPTELAPASSYRAVAPIDRAVAGLPLKLSVSPTLELVTANFQVGERESFAPKNLF